MAEMRVWLSYELRMRKWLRHPHSVRFGFRELFAREFTPSLILLLHSFRFIAAGRSEGKNSSKVCMSNKMTLDRTHPESGSFEQTTSYPLLVIGNVAGTRNGVVSKYPPSPYSIRSSHASLGVSHDVIYSLPTDKNRFPISLVGLRRWQKDSKMLLYSPKTRQE